MSSKILTSRLLNVLNVPDSGKRGVIHYKVHRDMSNLVQLLYILPRTWANGA